MATYPFWKLHGLGNDFVFFDAMEEELELSTAEVAALCDRHTGIGGDGVIVVKPTPRRENAGKKGRKSVPQFQKLVFFS